MNTVSIIGNLTRDPDTRLTTNGSTLTKIGIAYNRGSGENKETHFFDVVAWDKTAEIISKNLQKGDRAGFTGFLSYEEWIDKNNGQKRSKVYITAREVDFIFLKTERTESKQQNNNERKA